ncbi:MAG: hypothetical protein OEO79_13645 [Gemmatimonadota bacterium]|nr:hypothetical protein [Gemmatimonadota bacterium]
MFGAPGLIHGPDDAEVHTLQPKRAAVLAYLTVASPGRLHGRDSLLAMFWPDHNADRGRNALSKVIHDLGRVLPPGALLTQRDQVGIAGEYLWCDVMEFERELENGRAEDALVLYRGDLLQGFHLPSSPGFDHWSDVERSRLRRMAVASAWELTSDAERSGDGSRATKFARQAVEWAPRDESGHRRLLSLLQRLGNRAEALDAFEAFARELRRDYGVDPSGPTLELVAAIRDGSLPCDLAAPFPVGAQSAAPSFGRLHPEEPAEPEPSTGMAKRAAAPPRPDSKPRRRLPAVALAVAAVGLVALSAYRGDLDSRVTDGRPAGRVLVTEFADGTDEGLGAVVSEALRIDLARSRALDLVDRADIAETLELMGRRRGVPISAQVGRELAVRDGLETLVEGTVVPAGSGYILTAAIRAGSDGRTIASFRESVTSPDEMIPAIEALSSGIRAALGEERGTIHATPPLARVTTSSLEALTFYTRATQVFSQFDDRPRTADLLVRSIALDPGFAMAWRRLAVALQDDADQSRRLEAVRQAYRHRDRLSELERYLVEASYHAAVESDHQRAVAALLRVLEVDADHGTALNNLGINYLYLGEIERAEETFQRLVETPGASGTAYRNLADTRMSMGRIEEAFQTLAEFERAYPNHEQLPGLWARARFLSGAIDGAKAELQRIVDDPLRPAGRRADAWALLGHMAYWDGRHEEGRRGLLEAERADARADEATVWARVVETAHTAALVGDVEWARAHVETRLASDLPEDVRLDRTVRVRLIELAALTSAIQPGDLVTDEHVTGWRLANAHARIQSGDTLGVRAIVEGMPLHNFQRALLSDRLGDTDRTIELYEMILQPGYTGWGNSPQRIRALMRLGPLYEETGDTLKAIEAYRSFSRRWASGDRQGRAVAERFAARALALEGKIVAGSE